LFKGILGHGVTKKSAWRFNMPNMLGRNTMFEQPALTGEKVEPEVARGEDVAGFKTCQQCHDLFNMF
jgi:mono/diheme cytochrome c family protein